MAKCLVGQPICEMLAVIASVWRLNPTYLPSGCPSDSAKPSIDLCGLARATDEFICIPSIEVMILIYLAMCWILVPLCKAPPTRV